MSQKTVKIVAILVVASMVLAAGFQLIVVLL